jgi:hypothetical protein
VLLVGLAAPARSDPPPLPWKDQEQVNFAIDRGVAFLRQAQLRYTQGQYGTWARKDLHRVGYTALPGLTLLECGVSPKDDAVVRAANYVRRYAGKLTYTYDIALAILFLDRLGDAKDRPLIQRLALRLVAGQGPTGGWGYRCPVLDADAHKQLLTVLRQLDPPVLFNPLNTPRPGLNEAIAGLRPRTGAPLTTPSDDHSSSESDSSYPNTEGSSAPRSPGEPPVGPPSPGELPPADDAPGGAPADGTNAAPGRAFRLLGWDFKMQEDPPEATPPAPGLARKASKTPRIPARMTGLPVLHDARALPLFEPRGSSHVPVYGRTDNSNTQFALLALWAARRHDVPAARSLNLLTRRFLTSQNGDGSWGYRYFFGGGNPERPPMTCVGLLGLAVGYGLAHEAGAAPKGFVQDPRIVHGFAALDKNIGTPAGRMRDLPMQNLYFLWSVERVGVLYNVRTIGDKDWYRWGAEILVANQQRDGYWARGGYHGADATIDTCLALLFLKRANLTTDLASRLPFNSVQLQEAIAETLNPPAPPADSTKPADKSGDKRKGQPDPAETSRALREPIGTPPATPPLSEAVPAPVRKGISPPSAPAEAASEDGGGWWVWLLLILALLLVGAGLLLVLLRDRDDPDEDRPSKRARGRRTKRVASGG